MADVRSRGSTDPAQHYWLQTDGLLREGLPRNRGVVCAWGCTHQLCLRLTPPMRPFYTSTVLGTGEAPYRLSQEVQGQGHTDAGVGRAQEGFLSQSQGYSFWNFKKATSF